MYEDLEIRAQWANWYQGIELFGRIIDKGYLALVQPLLLETITDSSIAYPAFVTLSKHTAQILLNDLWQCGLRPSDDVGSVGELKATKNHLEDMRNLVG